MSESGYRKGHIPPPNSMERGYLIDASKLKPQHEPKHPSTQHPAPAPAMLPPIVGELVFPNQTTVRGLARLLKQKPFQIIKHLMGLECLRPLIRCLISRLSSSIARKYGFIAKKDRPNITRVDIMKLPRFVWIILLMLVALCCWLSIPPAPVPDMRIVKVSSISLRGNQGYQRNCGYGRFC